MDNCIHQETKITVRLIDLNRGELYPKYIPQVKESCAICGKYIAFLKQTPELIAAINQQLETITFDTKPL